MKIAYIIDCALNVEKPCSVFKKVLLQAHEWVISGHSVSIYSVLSGVKYDVHSQHVTKLRMLRDSRNPFVKLSNMWLSSSSICRDINAKPVDIIYTRYLLFTISWINLIKHNKVIMEINSNDDVEYKRNSLFTQLYNKMFKTTLLKNIFSFVAVTHELAKYISSYSEKEVEVIGNGTLQFFSPSSLAGVSSNYKANLLFVASPGNACHGLDVILEMATQLSEYQFTIVGYDGDSVNNIEYTGYLHGKDLKAVLNNADIGISALAIQRHGMHEACPLKSREYFSHGLPVIGNYSDPDMSNTEAYLKISPEKNLDIAVMDTRKFISNWMAQTDRKELVLTISKPLLSTEFKEKKRLVFFERAL